MAERLWYAAGFALGSLPGAMAIAHRSSSLVISLAAIAALAAIFIEGDMRGFAGKFLQALGTPPGIGTLAFLGYAALSLTWSVAPYESMHVFVEFALTLAAGLVLAVALPGRVPHDGASLLAIGVAVACALIVTGLWTGNAARRFFEVSAYSFIFNRPTLTVVVVSIPILLLLHRSRKFAQAAALAAMVVGTVLSSESGAAALGVVAAVAVYGIAHLSGRATLRLTGAGLVAAILIAPLSGAILDRLVPRAVHEIFASTNSLARVEIWKTFGEIVTERPLLGWGYGVSPHLSNTLVASRSTAANPDLSNPWHPHNLALQTWVELGSVGVILVAGIVILVLRELERLRPALLPAALALLAAVAAVSLVGHGAWQSWWPAAIATAIVWFRCGEREFRPRIDGQDQPQPGAA
jgi:O-antigen ligase